MVRIRQLVGRFIVTMENGVVVDTDNFYQIQRHSVFIEIYVESPQVMKKDKITMFF